MLLPYFRSSLKSPWTYIEFESASICLPISRCFLSHFHTDVYNRAPLSIFSLSFVFSCVLLPLPDWSEFLMVHPCLTRAPLLAAPTPRLVPWPDEGGKDMKKEHRQRLLYRRAGVRWAICIRMESTNCWQQPRASSCLLWTAEQEGISYFRYEVSVGEQAQAVKVWEEEAAVAGFCMNWSIICKHYYQHAPLKLIKDVWGTFLPMAFSWSNGFTVWLRGPFPGHLGRTLASHRALFATIGLSRLLAS